LLPKRDFFLTCARPTRPVYPSGPLLILFSPVFTHRPRLYPTPVLTRQRLCRPHPSSFHPFHTSPHQAHRRRLARNTGAVASGLIVMSRCHPPPHWCPFSRLPRSTRAGVSVQGTTVVMAADGRGGCCHDP
jgi:hypothetical protein